MNIFQFASSLCAIAMDRLKLPNFLGTPTELMTWQTQRNKGQQNYCTTFTSSRLIHESASNVIYHLMRYYFNIYVDQVGGGGNWIVWS